MFASRLLKVVSAQSHVNLLRQSTKAALNFDDKPEEDNVEWSKAKPYSEIPGPTRLGFITSAMPGGKYANLGFDNVIHELKKEYGDLVKLPGIFGKRDFVFLFDPKDIEAVYRNSGPWPVRRGLDTFVHYRKEVRPDIFKGMGGLITEQGEEWQKLRTILNPIMMQPRVVQKYAHGVDAIAVEFVDYLKECIAKNEPPNDFFVNLNKWALESICYIAIDTRLGVIRSEKDVELIKLVREFFKLSFHLDIMPSIWKYYKTPMFNQLMKVFDGMSDILMKHIDEAYDRLQNKTTKDDHEESVFEKCLKIDKQIAFVMAYDMLSAGVDTTSTSTVSILYLLAKNPDKQEILRQEIIRIVPDKNAPLSAEDINNMPYLRSCIKEGMRIQPIGGGNLRSLYTDTAFKGYQVPKGAEVVLGHLPLQRSEEHFPRQSEFIPERWLKEPGQQVTGCPSAKSANPFTFLPFGFGSRACIGKRFAELEMSTLIIRMIRNFEITWNRSDLKYKSELLTIPAEPVTFTYKQLSE